MANISGRAFPSLRVPASWRDEERSLIRQIEDLFDRLFLGNFKIRPGSKLAQSVTDYAYPVGSIYICESDTNPAAKLGGEWEAVTSSIGYAWKRIK